MKKHAMLDIETLGTRNDSIILSIGAVMFTDKGLGKKLYRRVCIDSCVESGFKLTHSTMRFWLEQSKPAIKENFFESNVDIVEALWTLSSFLNSSDEEVLVWANWVNFDIAILQTAFEKLDIQIPWKYNHVRCYGTVKNVFTGIPFNQSTRPHCALEDAVAQAEHLILINQHAKGALL